MVTLSATVSVTVPVGDDKVVMVCRRPTAAELSRFLGDRFESKGKKVKSRLYEARTALVDKILVDARGASFQDAAGETRVLDASTTLNDDDKRMWAGIMGKPVETWKDLIPESWKSSVAMTFEDAQPDEESDSGN
jgi:hypothetical protein